MHFAFSAENSLANNLSQKRKIARIAFLNNHTLVIFESLTRLNNTLNVLLEVYGHNRFIVAREISKLYETVHFGVLGRFLYPRIYYRGECVIIVENRL